MKPAVDIRVRVELEAVARMIEQLDYYQALRVAPGADRKTVERAFVTESRRFHPDRFHGSGDADVYKNATRVFRRISEAWSVLRDPKLRSAYDRRRAAGGVVGRITKADLELEAQREDHGPEAQTAQGRRYLEHARQAERAGNLQGEVMNAQLALMAEPGNEGIRVFLEAARARLASRAQGASGGNGSPPAR